MSPTPLNGGALADAVRGGQHSLGTFIGMATPVSAEVCAASGFDWVLLDLEHGAGGEEQIRDVVPAAGSYGVPPSFASSPGNGFGSDGRWTAEPPASCCPGSTAPQR
jgi:hypothetical protein